MLPLAMFAALALLAAGFFAVMKGDTLIIAALLVALCLTTLVAVPHVPALLAALAQVIDSTMPVALR